MLAKKASSTFERVQGRRRLAAASTKLQDNHIDRLAIARLLSGRLLLERF
jgi:hypothetical protein